MNTCKNCRHWKWPERSSWDNRLGIDYWSEGKISEEELVAEYGFRVRVCCSPEIKYTEKPNRDGAMVRDAENYLAELLTGEDFGCVCFEARK